MRRVFRDGAEFVDSCCYDISFGLQSFINSGTGVLISKLGMHLEEKVVKVRVTKELTCPRREASSSSSSNSSSSDDDNDDSGHDCGDGMIVRKGVKVSEIESETYAHGFGLRNGDIIITVNDKQVKSAAMVANMLKRIVKYSKNSKLRMEIHRKERGLIILDNAGDDLFRWDCDEVIRLDETVARIRNVEFEKYLIVKSGKLRLSKFRTPEVEKWFKVTHYVKSVAENEEHYITLEHRSTGNCIWVDDEEVQLKPPPSDSLRLPIDSKYLIRVSTSAASTSRKIFEPVNENGKAIGFTKRSHPATLLDTRNSEVQFDFFI